MIFAIMPAMGLLASSSVSNAAPRTIDDCEKIQAADAYNQCLAIFGPIAHRRSVSAQNASESASAEAPATESAAPARRKHRSAHARHHSRHHVSRHAAAKHGRHAKAKAASPKGKKLAFSVVSGHSARR
jgi:hypothetical protein